MPEKESVRAPSRATNLYRHRWAVQLDEHEQRQIAPTKVATRLVQVGPRFPGGMFYESGGQSYVLTESVFGQYPFLLVFRLPQKAREKKPGAFPLAGVPDQVLAPARALCENIAANLRLPETLHNIELNVTETAKAALRLSNGWELSKAIMKIGPIDIGRVACDCDVDGPCGYCCDTCDGQPCDVPCDCGLAFTEKPIEVEIEGIAGANQARR